MVSSASSQEMRSHCPLPRGPTRRRGYFSRSGWYICSMMVMPFSQAWPRFRGASGSGRTFTTRPFSTVRMWTQPP